MCEDAYLSLNNRLMKSFLLLVLLISSAASAQFTESYEANRRTEHLLGNVLSVAKTGYVVDSLDTNHLISDGDDMYVSYGNDLLEFDTNGNLVRKIAFFHGDTSGITVREFNAANKIIHCVYLQYSGKITLDQLTEYVYDSNNRMIRETKSSDWQPARSRNFTYDRYGRQLLGKDQYLFNNPVGKAGDTVVYTTEKNGELVAVYYNRLRELKHRSYYEVYRYDTLGRMTSDSSYTPDHRFGSAEVRRYDGKNRMVLLTRTRAGKPAYSEEITYDDNGNESVVETKENGQRTSILQVTYVLDDRMNWIVKRIAQNGRPAYVIKREIVYAD